MRLKVFFFGNNTRAILSNCKKIGTISKCNTNNYHKRNTRRVCGGVVFCAETRPTRLAVWCKLFHSVFEMLLGSAARETCVLVRERYVFTASFRLRGWCGDVFQFALLLFGLWLCVCFERLSVCDGAVCEALLCGACVLAPKEHIYKKRTTTHEKIAPVVLILRDENTLRS